MLLGGSRIQSRLRGYTYHGILRIIEILSDESTEEKNTSCVMYAFLTTLPSLVDFSYQLHIHFRVTMSFVKR